MVRRGGLRDMPHEGVPQKGGGGAGVGRGIFCCQNFHILWILLLTDSDV